MLLGLPPQEALQAWLWFGRLWPVIPIVGAYLFFRTKLTYPFAFIVLGFLVCAGVHGIVGPIVVSVPASVPADASYGEQMFRLVLIGMARTIGISFVLSIPVLWWLLKLSCGSRLGKDSAS